MSPGGVAFRVNVRRFRRLDFSALRAFAPSLTLIVTAPDFEAVARPLPSVF